ncbi:MAG: hypothetical protein ACPGLV_02560 [Bacteroidia bacterium]
MRSEITKKDFFVALAIGIALLIPYEYYMKTVEYWPAGYDVASYDMWADWRGKVDDLSEDDIVIVGSSRGHFDINIHLWDSITGVRPIMLAYPGSSPYHIIEDLVEKSDFKGLLVISTAPGLFYTIEGSWGANQGKTLVDHYYNRTYAQRFSNEVYKLIDPLFSYTQGTDLNLTSLKDRIPLKNREGVHGERIWPPMVNMDKYRNVRMIKQMETDSALQKQQTDIWFSPNPKNKYADSVDTVLGFYVNLVKKHKEKGGRVAFIRPPVSDYYLEMEPRLYPREKYWDRMLKESSCIGFHFKDHTKTQNMEPPEWSHLNRNDADIFTESVIEFVKANQLL